MIQPKDVPDLDLVKDGMVISRPAFVVNLFGDRPFSTLPQAVLSIYEMFLKLCPPEQLTFYATETMDQHKETSSRTFSMLPTWLKEGAPPREYVHLELMSGERREAIPDFRLLVSGYEKGSIGYADQSANLIRIAVPASWGEQHPREMRDMVIHMAGLFPYTCGHAGFAMEWSAYFRQEACPHAYRKGMRHLGFDIHGSVNDRIVVGYDSIKSVAWLTLLGEGLSGQLGGADGLRQRLSERVKVRTTGAGVMLEAGEAPEIGDVNRGDPLPAYAEVYAILEPIAEIGIQRSKMMTFLPGDKKENTLRWLRRFAERR